MSAFKAVTGGFVMDIFGVMRQFSTQAACIKHLEAVRWSGKPVCPYCGTVEPKPTPIPKQRYHCNSCNASFSVTVGTIFHHSHLPLQKWFVAISLIVDAKKGISARQLSRHLDVNKTTAWRIAMKIREAMKDPKELLCGIIEMDETFVGGKPRKGAKKQPQRRGMKKMPVVGMIERGGKVKAWPISQKDITVKNLKSLIRKNIYTEKSILVTDGAPHYKQMSKLLPHYDVNHTLQYVDGWIHTNTVESFWAILKRGVMGQFHKVSARYLYRYVNEFAFRFNHRDDKNIFDLTIKNGVNV